MSKLPDPILDGIERGWRVLGGQWGAVPEKLNCDVVVIGAGAGAGITAELLSKAGLSVVIVEEGPLKSSRDFWQREAESYAWLYQEGAGRKTKDKGVTILQGRCVGGGTTVNWTSSFRTPDDTLQDWQDRFGLVEYRSETLAPFFEQVEQRLNITPWAVTPNENNAVLQRGAARLGITTLSIPRNVKGCYNLGSCGMGCPVNAKQSMLLSTIPYALDKGATLLVETRAQQLELSGGLITALSCIAVKPNGAPADPGQSPTRIVAKHYVLAGGAINSPALLLRSGAPDPHQLLGKRSFLHPVAVSVAVMKDPVEGWSGAPQSVYSDHFLNTQPLHGPIGFKLEVAPLHPVFFGTNLPGFGEKQAALYRQFPHANAMLALMRDGFHSDSMGGRVELRADGSPVLDYPLTEPIMDGARRALLAMAQIQFEAGATVVHPGHEMAQGTRTWAATRAAIEALPMKPLLTKIGSAHQMGGCGMSSKEEQGVTRPDGQHWQIANLSVHDGSLFPTSIGANPQLSIYGIANRLTQQLIKRLADVEVALV